MVSRVTNLSSNKLVQSIILKSQDRINDAQLKLSTQQKSQDYLGIGSDASRLVTLEASNRRIDQFLQDNSFVNMRIQAMLTSMDAVKKVLKDVRGLVREVLDDGNVPGGFDKDEIAAIKMDEIQNFLNVKMNGRFLFAGNKTDTKPVEVGDITSAPTFVSNVSTAEPAFYYKGDDSLIKARIDEGIVLDYGVTANDPAFEKLIRSVRIIRSTDLTDVNANAKFLHVQDLLNQSEDALEAMQLKTGVRLQQLDKTNTNLKDTKNIFSGLVTDIESANTFEAVAELNQVQTMLEASYSAVVRVNGLTLTNFMAR